MSILRALFGKEVEVDQTYIFEDFEKINPFKEKERHIVVVKGVKEGFVNYRHLNSSFFQNESMTVRQFRFNYKAYTAAPNNKLDILKKQSNQHVIN